MALLLYVLLGNRDPGAARRLLSMRFDQCSPHHLLLGKGKFKHKHSAACWRGRVAGFDVVSGGELERVLVADRRAARKLSFPALGNLVKR